jgi:DNA-binding FadR family transcriptional regulator
MNANELTDKDLEDIYQTMTGIEVNYYEYARACIKKAQEKIMQSVMSKNCTCYKLGYSQLNNYRKVNNENNNEAA